MKQTISHALTSYLVWVGVVFCFMTPKAHSSNFSTTICKNTTFSTSHIKKICKKSNNLYGLTLDNLEHLSSIILSLKSMPFTPTTRVVFDEFIPAKNYIKGVASLAKVSYVMGEI